MIEKGLQLLRGIWLLVLKFLNGAFFKADRLQMIVVTKKYICVVTVHQ